MQPGISRAVPMGVLGFLFGALVVIGLRSAQSLTPIWDVGAGMVLGTIFCAIFFVWGIGAFDPRLSVHGEEEHDDHHEHAEETPPPAFALLSSSIWQFSFLLLLLIVALAAMAALGPALITTDEPGANVRAIGMTSIELFGQEMELSYLVIFTAFVIFALVSLAVTAGLLWLVFQFITRGLVEAKALPTGQQAAAETMVRPARPEWQSAIFLVVVFTVVFVLLYLLFYYVAIGLVVGAGSPLLVPLSIINALVIALLIVRPNLVLGFVAWVLRLVTRILRAIVGSISGAGSAGMEKPDRRGR